jgi:hypothetical protein
MRQIRGIFWMVYGEGQRAPAVTHHSPESATNEARRLARAHPGIRFFVLVAQRGYMTADPITEIEIDDGIPF